MKKIMMLVLLLLAITITANSALSSPAYTAEMLIDDWSIRFIDPAYWSSKWLSESTSSQAVVPSEKHTPQQDALRSAVETIIQLGLETPASLSQYYDVKFEFYFFDDYDMYAWDIDLYSEQKLVYTIRIDANSGKLFAIYINNSSNIPDRHVEQNHSIDALIDHWDKLYSDLPNYSPEVYAGEMQDWPLPSDDDIPQRTVLHYAIEMILTLSNHEIDVLYDYHPDVEFDVSPAARRWYITILQEPNNTGLCEIFTFSINAMTGKLENLTWRNIQFGPPA